MTPLQLACAECPYHVKSDGSCRGAEITDHGETTQYPPHPQCLVTVGIPCPFLRQLIERLIDASGTKDIWRQVEVYEAKEKHAEMRYEYNEHNRKHPGLSEDGVARGSFGGIVWGDSRANAKNDPGGRSARDSAGTREIHFLGRGRVSLARDKEVQSRLIRRRF
jgi:hypothetical protein